MCWVIFCYIGFCVIKSFKNEYIEEFNDVFFYVFLNLKIDFIVDLCVIVYC